MLGGKGRDCGPAGPCLRRQAAGRPRPPFEGERMKKWGRAGVARPRPGNIQSETVRLGGLWKTALIETPGSEIRDQKSISAPGAGTAGFFSGSWATIASVVISRPATEAASCSAVRTTLAGSMMPVFTRSHHSPLAAS